MELIYYLAPGALTYLVSEKLSGRKIQNTAAAIIETLLYAGLDMGILWFIRYQGQLPLEEGEPAIVIGEQSGPLLWASLLVALIAGIVIAYLKSMKITAELFDTENGIADRLSPKARKLAAAVSGIVLLAAVVGLIFAPQIRANREKASLDASRQNVKAIYNELKEEVKAAQEAGTSEDLEDLKIQGCTASRVTSDQRWQDAGSGDAEAVYMLDGNGTLVYYSYRDKNGAATWSGPSDDPNFIEANGGWNGGSGSGWTGTLSK